MRAPVLIPLIVACALFMENLDQTIIATALPAIARDIGVNPIALKLGVTSYLLSQAVFTPASGWMADRFGARLVFRLAIGLFTVASFFCGTASSIGGIVLWRVVQGFGGAMMVPVGRLLVLRSVSRAEMVSALAWLTVPAVIGPILGPPVGGFITTYFHWRYIFWINIPIGIIGIILVTMYVPDVRAEGGAGRFDPIGFVLTGIGLAALVSGSTSLGLGVIPIWGGLLMAAVGAACLLLYVPHARRSTHPIMDLSLFRLPTFRSSMTGGSLFRIGMGASPFLLPLMFQFGFGLSPFHSGMLTLASAVGAMMMKLGTPPLLRIFGFRTILVGNSIVSALLVPIPALYTAATPEVLMVLGLFVGGFFRSLQFTTVGALSYAEVEASGMSAATSIASVAQPVCTSIGVSLGALALEASMNLRGGTVPVAGDFPAAFLLVGFVAVLSFFFFNALPRSAGADFAGHRGARPAAPAAVEERTKAA